VLMFVLNTFLVVLCGYSLRNKSKHRIFSAFSTLTQHLNPPSYDLFLYTLVLNDFGVIYSLRFLKKRICAFLPLPNAFTSLHSTKSIELPLGILIPKLSLCMALHFRPN
jgi:hypothetical protein